MPTEEEIDFDHRPASRRPTGSATLAEYLTEQIGNGDGQDRARQIVRRARRKLGLPQPKPTWCGDPECDEQTRLREIDTEDGPKARKCPTCHPDRAEGRL